MTWRSRWLDFKPETPTRGAAKTDRTTRDPGFGSFGSASPMRFHGQIPGSQAQSSEVHDAPTERSVVASSVASGPGGGSGDSLNQAATRLEQPGGALPRLTEPSDPRPELEADSLAWAHLLAYASTDRSDFKGLYGVIHGARCGGALLTFTHGRWRIEPRIDPAELVSVWHDLAAWEVDRERYLLPHRERLTRLLRLVPTPSRLGAPPDPLTAGVAALTAFDWRLGLSPEDGLTAEHPTGGAGSDAIWLRAHHAELAELLHRETDCAPKEGM